jgi:hypothetical protein
MGGQFVQLPNVPNIDAAACDMFARRAISRFAADPDPPTSMARQKVLPRQIAITNYVNLF